MEPSEKTVSENTITEETTQKPVTISVPLPPEEVAKMKVILIGALEPIPTSTLEAIAATFRELGEENINFGVVQPNEVAAYMKAKEEEFAQKSMEEFLKDEENVKRAEVLAKKLDDIFKTEGKWCNLDNLVRKISLSREELINHLMSLKTFGFIEVHKKPNGKLMIKFLLTSEQRDDQRVQEVKLILQDLKSKLALVIDSDSKSLLNKEIAAISCKDEA